MITRVPANFDANAYAAAYPDVALSGLDPREHYRRFGRMLNRSPTGQPGVNAPSDGAEAEGEWTATATVTDGAPSALIERPHDLDLADLAAPAAPPRAGSAAGAVSLELLADGPFDRSSEPARLISPLTAYARLTGVDLPAILPPLDPANLCGSNIFSKGRTRIENAWYAGSSTIRLMFAEGDRSAADAQGWMFRAYQALPASPEKLREAGQGFTMSGVGPGFHDIELLHPLMPVILEISDSHGFTQGIGLLPFPSLLRGGMHAAELRAFQTRPNPLDAFWHLSSTLLEECLGQAGSPGRSIASLEVAAGEGGHSYPSPQLAEWVQALFGLAFQAGAAPAGVHLRLPANSFPTIGALVSRRLAESVSGSAIAPFLVAETETMRPRWSVVLPVDHDPAAPVPTLEASRPAAGNIQSAAVPIHVAIVQRPATVSEADLLPSSPTNVEEGQGQSRRLTVVMDASDTGPAGGMIDQLSDFAGEGLELFVSIRSDHQEMRRLLDDSRGPSAWREISPAADLREIARLASNETLLTIDDRIALDSPGTIAALCNLLEGPEVASASCVLLGEHVVKKKTVLRPASGGLFPSQVSFVSSPRLGFAEPDVLHALDGLIYPVVANSFLLTAWKRSALAALPASAAYLSDRAADIRTGLDLMAAGYRNLCSARLRATFRGPYARRDAIDPLGSAYLQPARWEDILGRVTVLRELI